MSADSIWVKNKQKSAEVYRKEKPGWVIFGNTYKYLSRLSDGTKTAQLGHGIGPKPSYYYKSSTPMTVRFIEGDLCLKKSENIIQTAVLCK